jgi:urea carboxylase
MSAASADAVAVPERATAVLAPFTASVWQVAARPGSQVVKGDKLVSLEAMKMETILTAPHDGTVADVYVTVADQVTAGQVVTAVLPDGDAGAAAW